MASPWYGWPQQQQQQHQQQQQQQPYHHQQYHQQQYAVQQAGYWNAPQQQYYGEPQYQQPPPQQHRHHYPHGDWSQETGAYAVPPTFVNPSTTTISVNNGTQTAVSANETPRAPTTSSSASSASAVKTATPAASAPKDDSGLAKEAKRWQTYGSQATMNMESRLVHNIPRAEYFTKTLRSLENVTDDWVGEVATEVHYLQPWASGDLPSTAYCLLFKLHQMKPETTEVESLLRANDPMVVAMGLLFIRYTCKPALLWPFFSQVIKASAKDMMVKVQLKQREVPLVEFATQLLLKPKHAETLLPRIPVNSLREIERNLDPDAAADRNDQRDRRKGARSDELRFKGSSRGRGGREERPSRRWNQRSPSPSRSRSRSRSPRKEKDRKNSKESHRSRSRSISPSGTRNETRVDSARVPPQSLASSANIGKQAAHPATEKLAPSLSDSRLKSEPCSRLSESVKAKYQTGVKNVPTLLNQTPSIHEDFSVGSNVEE